MKTKSTLKKSSGISLTGIIMIRVVMVLFFVSIFLIPLFARENGNDIKNGYWLWTFLGKLHPLVVHFPIGVLGVALLMEVVAWKRKSVDFTAATQVLIVVGAVSSVLAVAFGLLLSNSEDYESTILPVHQWLGIGTMVLATITAWAYFRYSRLAQRILLVFTVVVVFIAGHFGAMLTRGEDYLTSALPSDGPNEKNQDSMMTFAEYDGPLSDGQVQEINLQVRTILAHNCYSCHGRSKAKGKLRLDTREFVMKGGEDGVILVPGHPEKSEIIRRIELSPHHRRRMPAKGKRLTKEEIATIRFWIQQGVPWPEGPEKSLYRVAALEPRMPVLPPVYSGVKLPIDRFVNAYFQKNKIMWGSVVDDRTYIRRVYLDVTGLMPAPDLIDAFIRNPQQDKREQLVRALLNRNADYAQHWLTFWNDALRNDYTGAGYIDGGRSDITKWLYSSLKNNKPYDAFVRELISPEKESNGFIRGIKWRGSINASQRIEMQAAQNVSQVFLGLNIKCASCHDSFINDWRLDDAYAFANIFADSSMEINRCDKPTGQRAGTRILFGELGKIDSAAFTKDRLKQLADYLTQPKDGRLYRTLVNRIWAQLMGRGIIEPVDVMDKEPWSQDLLDWLASDFVVNGYDVKKLIYAILTSRTYQLPSVGVQDAESINAPEYVFRGMLRRRLTAEQFADAVSATLQPLYPDSAVENKLFPKTIEKEIPFARAGLVKNDPLLSALGRPNRETVSTSRASQANLLQALELTNGVQFNEAIRRGAIRWREKYPDAVQLVRAVYRSTLGRLPGKEEEAVAVKSLGQAPTMEATQDFMWAMTLHPEFQLIY